MSSVLLITMTAGCKSNGTDTKQNGVNAPSAESDTVSNETDTAPNGTGAASTGTIKIGFAMPVSDEINMNMRGSYETYAETLEGAELIFTSAEGDAEQQITDVENLISQNCDVIIIRPVDGQSIGIACDAVVNANIPLIIDEFIVDATNYTVRTFIDQADHGRVLGSYLQGLLDKGAIKEVKIGYIAGDSDSLMMSRRDGISETCTSAVFAADSVANNWSATDAQAIVENWISSGSINDMNVIVCMDDALANAAITALGDDYPDIIVFGAGGTNVLAQQNIASGKMKATTYQDNVVTAKKMLDVCFDLANGVEVKYDDAENRLLSLRSISIMTAETSE
jgi:putative multiple sugar transport system substrate-binding protein